MYLKLSGKVPSFFSILSGKMTIKVIPDVCLTSEAYTETKAAPVLLIENSDTGTTNSY